MPATGIPIVRSTSRTATGSQNAASFSLPLPSGTQDGDILLATFLIDNTGVTVTDPAGWTQEKDIAVSNQFRWRAYSKRASSETGDWQWSWTGTFFVQAACVAVQHAVTSGTYFDVSPTTHANNTTLGANIFPNVTAAQTSFNTLAVWFGMASNNIQTDFTPPTGYTKLLDGVNTTPFANIVAAYQNIYDPSTAASTSGAQNASRDGASASWVAVIKEDTTYVPPVILKPNFFLAFN